MCGPEAGCPDIFYIRIIVTEYTYEGEVRRIQGFGEERDHLQDPCVDGRVILRWIFGIWDVGA